MSSSEEDWLELADEPTEEFGGQVSRSASRVHGDGVAPPPAGAWRAPGQPGRVLRLAGVVAVLVLVPVVLVSLIGGSGHGALDRAYFSRLAVPAAASQAVGRAFERDLLRGGTSRASLAAQVETLATRQRAADATLGSLSPPPRLREEYTQAVIAFLERTNGLSGLVTGLRNAKTSAALLATQGARIIASDVLWQTFVQAPTLVELRSEGVSGIDPPTSIFLSSPDDVSAETFARALAGTPSAAVGAALLKLGDRGAAVAAWQTELEQWLKQTGQAVIVATNGTFDQATQSATISFQGTVGITADGIVGSVTQSAMTKTLGP